jgi:hypothetical protein
MNTANWDLQAHEARRGPVIALGAAFSIPGGLGVVEGNECVEFVEELMYGHLRKQPSTP